MIWPSAQFTVARNCRDLLPHTAQESADIFSSGALRFDEREDTAIGVKGKEENGRKAASGLASSTALDDFSGGKTKEGNGQRFFTEEYADAEKHVLSWGDFKKLPRRVGLKRVGQFSNRLQR